jgi:alpha-1,2-mannosyltransferase
VPPCGVLDRERLTNYPRIFIALYVLIGGWWLMTGPGLLDRGGTPIGGDFVTFYAAADMLRVEPAAALYDVERLHVYEQAVIGAEIERLAWHYPPPGMLAAWPLALVPFLVALAGWTLASLGAFIGVVRHIDREPVVLGLALAFPGLFQNLMHGQNGCFSLALLAGALLLVSRPTLGGLLLGLLVYKPHLMPLAALALLAGRHWRALGGMVASAGAFCLLSSVLGGWPAFFDNLDFAWRVLTEGGVDVAKVPTMMGATLLAGVPVQVGRVIHLLWAGVAAGLVCWAFWKRAPLRAGALAAGALLTTPFSFEYDLVIMALPLLLIGREREPADTPLLVIGWVTPLAFPGLAHLVPVQLTPLVLMWILWRCTRSADG